MRRSGYEITAEVKINKMAEKAEGWFKHARRKREKQRQVIHMRALGTRQSARGLVLAVHLIWFVRTV